MKNESIRILLVDDEPDILEIVGYNLSKVGYQIYTAQTGMKALDLVKQKKPHLIILDVMMPEMDGIEACERIRQIDGTDKTIITFLTARGEDYSQVAGLNAGADDYITKPIRPKVLQSKVKSLLRRLNAHEDNPDIIRVGDLTINGEKHKIIQDDTVYILPRKEFNLLYLLASKPEKVFTRDVIMDMVWGNEVVVNDRTIDVHIRKLREKIGSEKIQTVRGVGYKFMP